MRGFRKVQSAVNVSITTSRRDAVGVPCDACRSDASTVQH